MKYAKLIGALALTIPALSFAACSGTGTATSAEKNGGAQHAQTAKAPQQSQSDKPAEPVAEEPEMTSGQDNALQSAEDYIAMSGFSRAGLIEQLSSNYGEGYSEADATFAADTVDVDWNAEAVESAKDYLDMGGMSKSSLIDQLSSNYGEQFTLDEAQYAADRAY